MPKVAEEHRVSKNTVCAWLNRWHDNGKCHPTARVAERCRSDATFLQSSAWNRRVKRKRFCSDWRPEKDNFAGHPPYAQRGPLKGEILGEITQII